MKNIQYQQYGGPENMQIVEGETPQPGPDEVLVRVKAASINPVDWKVRQGQMRIVTGKSFPRGMGVDFAGTVEATGNEVQGLSKGAAVYGWVGYKTANTFGEYAIAKAELCVPKPEGLSFEQAACYGMTGCTAYKSLVELGGLTAGMEVLVNGCTGGVGHFATQIAKAMGATVTGVCGSDDLELAKSLGADRVLNYKTEDVMAGGQRFDLIFDTPGLMPFPSVKRIMKKRSVFVTVNPGPGVMLAQLTNLFSGKKGKMVITNAKRPYLEALSQFTEAGQLRAVVGKTFPFEEALEAIRFLESGGKVQGKAVLVMG